MRPGGCGQRRIRVTAPCAPSDDRVKPAADLAAPWLRVTKRSQETRAPRIALASCQAAIPSSSSACSLISRALADPSGRGRGYEYDAVHTSSEFAAQASDHDPQVARLHLGSDPPA